MIECPIRPGDIDDHTRSDTAENEHKAYYILIISFLNLLIFPLLYIFRAHDTNTLVSWQWVFHDIDLARMYLIVIIVMAMSYVLSRFTIKQRYFPFILAGTSFFCLVPLWGIPEMIIDASRYIVQAKFIELKGIGYYLREWGGEIHAWTDMPFIPFLYGLLFRYFAEVRVYLQLMNGIFFSLTVIVTYLLGKELWDAERGFYAGLFLMAIPFLIVQTPLIMVDVASMFFMTLAIYCYVRAMRSDSFLSSLVSAITIVVALLTKYSVWIMLLILPLITLINRKVGYRDAVKRSGRVFLVCGILSALIFVIKSDIFMLQFHLLRSFQLPALREWGEGHVSTFLFQTHPFLLALSCMAAYGAVTKRDSSLLVPGWFFLFIIIFHVQRSRYSIPLLPLFALTASYGLRLIRFDDVRRFTAVSMVGLSLVIVFWGYSSFLPETSMANLQKAGRYINAQRYQSVRVITLPQTTSAGNTEMTIPILDVYTGAKIFHEKRQFPALGAEIMRRTPLRFTWDYGLPEFYYDTPVSKSDPVVVISGERLSRAALMRVVSLNDKGLSRIQKFETVSGAFKYKVYVYVVDRPPVSG